MSIRYSGDVEIRLGYDKKARVYRGTVVDPHLRFHGEVSVRQGERDPTHPEAYDDAARRLVRLAESWAKQRKRKFMVLRKNGRIAMQRVFHAPCPLEDL